MDILPGMSLPT